MVYEKGFKFVSLYRIEKDLGKPIDCWNFIPCSSSAVRLFRRTSSVLRATLSMGLPGLPEARESLRNLPDRKIPSVLRLTFAKSRMEDVAKRLGRGKINSSIMRNHSTIFPLKDFGFVFVHAGCAEFEFLRRNRTK